MGGIDLEPLKSHPDAQTLKDTLLGVLEDSNVDSPELQVVLTIVKYVVPVYPSLTKDVKQILWKLVSHSLLYLTHCVTYANSLPKSQKQIEVYRQFLVDTLQSQTSLLYNYIQRSSGATKMQINTLKASFFGSRLFNVLSPTVDILQYLEMLQSQWLYIIKEHSTNQTSKVSEKEAKLYADFLVSQFKLHEVFNSGVMFDDLFFKNQENFSFLRDVLKNTPSILQRTLQRRYILPYLDRLITRDNYVTVACIIQQVIDTQIPPDLEYILSLKSAYMQALLMVQLLLGEKTVSKANCSLLTQKFGEVNEQEDENVCRVFTMLLKYSDVLGGSDQQCHYTDMAHDADFLNTVTKRLTYEGHTVRERTMYIAKLVTRGQLKYESDFEIEVPDVEVNKILDESSREKTKIDFSQLHLNTGSSDTVDDSLSENVDLKLQRLSLQDSDDSDDEDLSDNPDVNAKQRLDNIVFLKDLLAEFVEGSREGFQRQIPLLKRSVKLVRQKRFFPSEVAYYAPLLFSNIAMLNNRLDEENFEQWRVNTLTSILVVVPEKIDSLYQVLFTTELSLQQRISLLYSLAFAARELRGVNDDDNHIVKPQYDFPTRRLPWDKQPDKESTNPTHQPLSRPQRVGETTTLDDSITAGTVVWRSRGLDIRKGKTDANVNNFRQHAAAFFYPLANAWLNGIDLGTFDRLFKMHYLSTLKTIYTCAYPVHDYESMTALMERIALDAVEQGVPLQPIK